MFTAEKPRLERRTHKYERTYHEIKSFSVKRDKRKNISIGDTIIFVNTENANDTLHVVVKNLFVFASFAELYDNLPLLKCGYNKENIDTASSDDMELYYSREKQSQFGVIGIEIYLK